jgi:hypothetical protein
MRSRTGHAANLHSDRPIALPYLRNQASTVLNRTTPYRDTVQVRYPKCQIKLPTLEWHAISHMWNCGFTMSQAIAHYERLLVHHMAQTRLCQTLSLLPDRLIQN